MTRTEIIRRHIAENFSDLSQKNPARGSLKRAALAAGVKPNALSYALCSSRGPSVGLCVRLARAWGMTLEDELAMLGQSRCPSCDGRGTWLFFAKKLCSRCKGRGWLYKLDGTEKVVAVVKAHGAIVEAVTLQEGS